MVITAFSGALMMIAIECPLAPNDKVHHGDSVIPSSSVATLVALTQEAQRALGGNGEVRITQYPFKVGRESRSPNPVRRLPTELEEQRLGVAVQFNDVYLIEPPSESFVLHISREHFAIECVDNRFFLVDRGSACGTIVAGKQVGGDRTGGRTELQNDDLVVVGTSSSPYVFRFEMVGQAVGMCGPVIVRDPIAV